MTRHLRLAAASSLLAILLLPHSLTAQSPAVTATKDDGIAAGTKVPAGTTVNYTNTISNAVGAAMATGVTFSDSDIANATLVPGSVNVSPLARDDTYATLGNTLLEVGVAASGNPAIRVTDAGSDSLFDNDSEFLGDTFTLKSVESVSFVAGSVTAATEQGGSVTVQQDGTFTYTPPAGFTGTDNFDYTITDDGATGSAPQTGSGRVTITVDAQRVWYVKNNAAAGGLGRSGDPFDTLAEAEAASAANDTIYVYSGDGATTGQNGGIVLKSGQRLLGEGVALTVPVGLNGNSAPTTLRGAGSRPRVNHTAGNGASATNVIPAEIAGLSLSGSANAIDVTITASIGGTLSIHDNVIFGAGAEGIDINKDGNATLTLNVQNNTWNTGGTHTGTAFDVTKGSSGNPGFVRLTFSNNLNILSSGTAVALDGTSSSGKITVLGFSGNSIHPNTGGSGVVANTVTFDSDVGTGGFQPVSGGTMLIGTLGNGVGASGMVLTNVAGVLVFTDLDIFADGGSALDASSTGVIDATSGTGFGLAVGNGVSTFSATGGPAVNISNATVDIQNAAISSTNSATTGVTLNQVGSGTTAAVFSTTTGSSITNATGTDFVISSTSAGVTYAGTITDDVGQLVSVSNCSGSAKTFSGAITDGNDGDGSGISLTNNGSSTIAFTGGLVLSTGANPAFTASGGGNIRVTGSANTITTTTGTALSVTGTTIDSSTGMTFRSIAVNGAANGIVLSGTGSGGLTITGTGGASSGGTIQNVTGDGIQLTNASNISLTDMVINSAGGSWIDATTVTNLTLLRVSCDLSTDHGFKASGLTNLSITGGTFDRGGAGNAAANFHGFSITNLLGTSTVSGSIFRRSNTIQFRVNNTTATNFAGAPDTLTVTNTNWNTHTSAFAGDHLSVNADTGGNFRLVVNSSAGINKVNDGGIASTGGGIGVQASASGTNGKMDVSVTGLKTSNNTAGVTVAQTGGGALTYNIFGNKTANGTGFSSTGSGAIFVTHASSGGTSSGTISDNSIDHTAGPGTNAMQVVVEGSSSTATGGTGTVMISQNSISGNFQRGIQLQARVANATLNATVSNNTFVGTDNSGNALQVVNIETGGSGSGHSNTIRLNMLNNSATFPGANYLAAYRLVNRAACTFQLQNFAGVGSSTTDIATWVTTTKSNVGTPVTVTATAAFAPTAGNVPVPLIFVPDEAGPAPLPAAKAQPQAAAGMDRANPFPALVRSSDSSQPALPAAAYAQDAASAAGPQQAQPEALSQEQLDLLVKAARTRWEATGLTAEQKQTLQEVKFLLAELPGWYLGEAEGQTIRIDADAGGNGWFIDATPMEDSEFTGTGSRLTAAMPDASGSAGRVDLLTTVMHEMGHALGLCDGYAALQRRSVMHGFLTKGERRLPQKGEALDAAPHAHAQPRHLSGDISIGDLPPGKSVTIVYSVTVNNALTWTGTQLASQGKVSGSNFSTVNGVSTSLPNTDDPNAAGAANPTVTLLDRPDTTVVSLLRTNSTPTKQGVVNWQIIFSQPVSNLSGSNFAVVQGGSGSVSGATVQSVVDPGASLPATTWNISVDSGTGDGTLGLNLANDTGLTHDVLSTLPFVGEVYTIDKTAPSTTSFARQTPASSPTNADSLVFSVTFSEDVQGVGPDDFTVTGTTATVIGVVAPTASSYQVTVAGGNLPNLDGTVGLNFNSGAAADFITDVALNNLPKTEPGTDQTYTLDNTKPTVAMTSAVGDPAVNSAIPVTVTFSESVTGFIAGDIVTSNGSVSNFAGSGTTYTFDLTPAGPGVTVTASIAAGVANDAAGNGNTAATQFSRTIVDQVSVATLNAGDNDAAETGGNTGTYTFTRGNTSGTLVASFQLDASSTATAGTDFTLSGTTTFSGGSGTVTFPDGQATVTVTLTAAAEAAVGGGQAAEAAETARLNVVPQAGSYVAGTPDNATVTIAANGFVVVNTNDSGGGSLRQAVQNANDIAGDDAITFAGTVFTDATVPDVISLTSGHLLLTSNTSITGPGANVITVRNGSGAGTENRVFRIDSSVVATLRGLTIADGRAGFAGGIDVLGSGGPPTTLNLLYCTVSGNTSASYAGGIAAGPSAVVNVINSTISGNTANASSGTGGGIDFGGSTLRVVNSTISGNSTPSGNGNGGGIAVFGGTATIVNSTITNNLATGASSGGGVLVFGDALVGGTAAVGNSVIAGNQNNGTVPDIFKSAAATATLTSSGGNVVGNPGSFTGFNQTNDAAGTGASPVNPLLGALSLSNGGTTATHALLAGSPALNSGVAGNLPADTFDVDGDSNVAETLPVDQRGVGFTRSIGATDSGAFELQKSVSIVADAASANEGASGTTNFTFTVSRTGDTTGVVSMTYTVSGAAVSGADFVGGTLPTGTASIADGSASTTVTIPVSGDTTREASEAFTVTLSSPDNGYVVSGSPATSTITNDDFEADLSITVTDGSTSEVPGTGVTYTITMLNAGPDPVTGANLVDVFPAVLSGVSWTGVGAGGGTGPASGTGNINSSLINLPAGGSFTVTVSGTVSASATGSLVNTATIAIPAGVGLTDTNLANNIATDTDTLTPQADLAVTKTDGVTTAIPGGSLTYTITTSNAGPSDASATVADILPAGLENATWTSVGAGGGSGTTSGSGNISDTVTLPAGSSVTYTLNCGINSGAIGSINNTATIAAAAGITDPASGNNSATDSDTLTPQADVAITMTDSPDPVTAGTNLTYTLTATNNGLSTATDATVSNTLPAGTTFVSLVSSGGWSATTPAVGAGGTITATRGFFAAGASDVFTLTVSVGPGVANGTVLSNTATIASSTTDPNSGNNSATATTTVSAQADLTITVTDGVTTAVPGGSVTYIITASNAGPSSVTGATVADTFPASLTGVTWTSAGAGGGTATLAGSGNISDAVNLPPGASVTYTVTGTVAASATGTLANTATVTAPAGVTDPTPANNSATDSDTLAAQADLAVTVSDSPDPVVAGNNLSYTITATNNGLSDAADVSLSDTLPAGVTFVSLTAPGGWSATTPAIGSGGTVNASIASLPAGASGAFTLTVKVGSGVASGTTLSNTATLSSATTDPTPGNNSGTAATTVTAQADLAITVTDGASTATPGGSVTYTITVSNAGPSDASSATVADTFPAILTSTWTAVGAGGGTATLAGSGNINDIVNLPAGGSVTYTVSATISAGATGTLSNTATVAAPAGVTDATPGNNSATDSDTLTPQADLAVTVTDGVTTATPGGSVTYTITVTNAGPSNAPGATVADTFPASLTATWTAVGAGGGTASAAGSGNINDTVNLPAGGSVTYTVSATISAGATGTLSNTATVAAPAGVTDATPGNNSATDSDTLTPQADLAVTMTDGVTTATPGGSVTYTITVTNAGPSNAPGATVADTFPASLTATWTAVGAGGGTASAAGSGNINDTVNLPAGGSVTYTVSATIATTAFGTLSNTATVAAPAGVTDPTPGNNSATDNDTLSTVVSIAATDATADENTAGTGTWRVTRNGTSGSLTVQLEISASSTAATADWTQSGGAFASLAAGSTGTVTIPDGSGFADITLTPAADIHAEAAESVQINIAPDAAYTAISPSSATITIGANDFVVINANDSGEGSLRQAVDNANTLAGDDVITFSAAQAVTLTSGELLVQNNGTLAVQGGDLVSISGNSSSRIFNVNSGATLTLRGLTLANGNPGSDGGAIYNAGMVTIISSTLSGNSAAGGLSSGGAIFNNSGAVGLVNSTVSGNSAAAFGGAVHNSTGIVSIVNSTVSGNTAGATGGGVHNDNGTLIVDSATITANSAQTGGGGVLSTGGAVTLYNSILAANTSTSGAPDLSSAAVATAENNLIGVSTGHPVADGVNGNLVGSAASPLNALLGPLANNGGPTQTHMLQDGSPAINAGSNASPASDTFDLDGDTDTAEDLPVDQRGVGFARLIGATVDIGAYEAFAFRPAITAATTNEDIQTASGLVVTPNTADGGLTTHFKITNIQNGTLYKNDGVTAISAGTFLTLTEGAAGLKFTPGLNLNDGNTATFGFDAQATVDGADTGLRTGVATATVSVTAVNDPPTVVSPGLADQTMTVGDTLSVPLPAAFTDVDGDTLTYSVQTNSDSAKAGAVINGTNVDLTALTYGVTNITIQASDGNTGTVTDTFQVAVGTVNPTPGPVPPPPGPGGYPVTGQTGLYDIVIPVTNTTAFPINGFRLTVDFSAYLAAYPSLRLYDSSSAPGVSPAFVDYPYPVAVGSTVNVKLSFYTSTRTFPNPFAPALSVTILPVSQVAGAAGPGVVADIRRNSGGEILLEWASTPGAWYRVQYSDDLASWYISTVPVQAGGTRTQWIDSGAPFTLSPPGASRFYRVNEIPAPTP